MLRHMPHICAGEHVGQAITYAAYGGRAVATVAGSTRPSCWTDHSTHLLSNLSPLHLPFDLNTFLASLLLVVLSLKTRPFD